MYVSEKRIHRERVSGRGEVVVSSGENLAIIIDQATAGTTYIGKAIIGAATSSASWQIKRLVDANSVTTITWADGNDNPDNIWDNRASLSYS